MPYYLAEIWKTDIDQLTTPELWEHYEHCLKAFDWTYNFSDDHGVWESGREQESHLESVRHILEQIDDTRADDLFYKYSFWHNPNGSRKE